MRVSFTFHATPRQWAAAIAISVVVGLLVGCAGQGSSAIGARTAVQYAVLKYIDDDAQKAQRVYDTATRASRALEDTETRLDLLKQAVLAQIDFAKMDTADQLVVRGLVDAIAAEISARQDSGRLETDTVVAVRTVLAWSREAALIVGAQPCSAVVGEC